MSKQVKDSMLQRIYLLQELDQTVLLLNSGLAVLQISKPYHRKTFIFLTLLASGIERLLKIILCLHSLQANGEFLSRSELKRLSHNISQLVDEVKARCFTTQYVKRPVAQQDLDFLNTDIVLQEIIKLLSDFARTDRYIFMDGISEPIMSHEWPDRRWETLEKLSLPEKEYIELLTRFNIEEIAKRANKQLVICLERFLRSVTRLFVLADLGDEAKSKATAVSSFYMLDDRKLGTIIYNI
jgi:hypothetical protein